MHVYENMIDSAARQANTWWKIRFLRTSTAYTIPFLSEWAHKDQWYGIRTFWLQFSASKISLFSKIDYYVPIICAFDYRNSNLMPLLSNTYAKSAILAMKRRFYWTNLHKSNFNFWVDETFPHIIYWKAIATEGKVEGGGQAEQVASECRWSRLPCLNR